MVENNVRTVVRRRELIPIVVRLLAAHRIGLPVTTDILRNAHCRGLDRIPANAIFLQQNKAYASCLNHWFDRFRGLANEAGRDWQQRHGVERIGFYHVP